MTKPEDWVYASMDALVNEHNLTLSSNQYEALAHVMSILGAGPFKRTRLMKRLIAGEMAAAHAEILRLAGNREGLQRTILETAAALFGKAPCPPRQPDDPGAPDAGWPRKGPGKPPPGRSYTGPTPMLFWALLAGLLAAGVALVFV